MLFGNGYGTIAAERSLHHWPGGRLRPKAGKSLPTAGAPYLQWVWRGMQPGDQQEGDAYAAALKDAAENLRLHRRLYPGPGIPALGAGDRGGCGTEVPIHGPLPPQAAGGGRGH